ncbi:MAG: FtsK/SpoIIIE domain-containing protein [Muribaculum sp.]|nr:FtsK/SpoIIIE domain-containing protein [Muribaculum sp.]
MNTQEDKMINPEINRSDVALDFNGSAPVALNAILNSAQFCDADMKLPIILGINERNEPIIEDLAEMPHLLVGGDAPSAISSFLQNVIFSLLSKKRPDELKFVLMNTSLVDFTDFESMGDTYLSSLPGEERHVISSTNNILKTFISLEDEMNTRHRKLLDAECSSIEDYNNKHADAKIPYLVVLLDEIAPLKKIYGDRFDNPVFHLAQKGRGVGIHMVLATNQLNEAIIDGFYLAKFPSRITFETCNSENLQMLIDSENAPNLSRQDEIMYQSSKGNSTILRKPYAALNTWDVTKMLYHITIRQLAANPYLLPEVEDVPEVIIYDPFFEHAARKTVEAGRISTPELQRTYDIGFHRATKLIEQLIEAGVIVSEADHGQYISIVTEEELQPILTTIDEKKLFILTNYPTPIERRLETYHKLYPKEEK